MSEMSDTSDVSDAALRLDGNAAAGALAEIFPVEMTTAQSTCATCGRAGPLGALLLYGGEMGTVLRCPDCDRAQLRLVRARGQYWLDLRGMTYLRMAPAVLA
jgi:hypothetical protein